MKKTIALTMALLSVTMLLLLCGCKMELPEVSEPKTTRTALVLLDVNIADLLSKKEMEDALGVTLRDPQVSNEGRTLFALSAEGGDSLSISVEERTIEEFRKSLPKVAEGELQAAPNLADEAWWLASGKTLFFYAHGYTVSVAVSGPDWDEESALLSARQVASLLNNRLPVA